MQELQQQRIDAYKPPDQPDWPVPKAPQPLAAEIQALIEDK